MAISLISLSSNKKIQNIPLFNIYQRNYHSTNHQDKQLLYSMLVYGQFNEIVTHKNSRLIITIAVK